MCDSLKQRQPVESDSFRAVSALPGGVAGERFKPYCRQKITAMLHAGVKGVAADPQGVRTGFIKIRLLAGKFHCFPTGNEQIGLQFLRHSTIAIFNGTEHLS